jgi:chitinase
MLILASAFASQSAEGACIAQNAAKRMVCYLPSWSKYRPSPGNMQVTDLDPCLCTHVIYAFVALSNNQISLNSDDTSLLPLLPAWKNTNPNIKILLSVGGGNAGTGLFTTMSSSAANINSFCQSAISYIRQYNLDGLDIDWEFPEASQQAQYSSLLQGCFNAFVAESKTSGKPRLLISAATAPDTPRLGGYKMSDLNLYLDMVNPMVYDMHGSWDGDVAHQSPLYGPEGAAVSLAKYVAGGVSPSKLNMPLAAYGRSTLGAATYTQEASLLAYFEVCIQLTNGWTSKMDLTVGAPKASSSDGTNWVYYDNPQSFALKSQYAVNASYGGGFTWDVSMDDFGNHFCNLGKFPLLNAAITTLNAGSSPAPATTTPSGPTKQPVTSQSIVTSAATKTASTSAATKAATTTGGNSGNVCAGKASGFVQVAGCTSYYQCYNSVGYLYNCPPGLLFNSAASACDWPANVKNC